MFTESRWSKYVRPLDDRELDEPTTNRWAKYVPEKPVEAPGGPGLFDRAGSAMRSIGGAIASAAGRIAQSPGFTSLPERAAALEEVSGRAVTDMPRQFMRGLGEAGLAAMIGVAEMRGAASAVPAFRARQAAEREQAARATRPTVEIPRREPEPEIVRPYMGSTPRPAPPEPGKPSLAERLRTYREETFRPFYGVPDTPFGTAAGVIGRMTGEGALFMAPGAALRGAATAARVGGRAAPVLERIASPATLRGRIVQDIATGAPIDAAIAAAGPEESLVGGFGELLGERPGGELLRQVAEDPRKRVAADVALGAALSSAANVLLDGGLRAATTTPAGLPRGARTSTETTGLTAPVHVAEPEAAARARQPVAPEVGITTPRPEPGAERRHGIVLAGNQRDMMEQRLRRDPEAWQRHVRAMEEAAPDFGLSPRQPRPNAVIRRVMVGRDGEPLVPVIEAGKLQETVFPGDHSTVLTRYAWVDAEQSIASHDPFTFEPRPPELYPEGVQGRAYHGERGRGAREQVEAPRGGFRSELFLDRTSSADGGVPILAPPDYDVEELRRLNAMSDVPRGKIKDALSDAATRAASMRSAGRALDFLGQSLRPEQTIRQYLETASGREFLRELIDDGVIAQHEAARYVDAGTGAITDDGKRLIERMLQVAAIGDPDVVARATDASLRKLEHAYPAIVRASMIAGWDISPTIREALDILAAARAAGSTIEDFLAQQDVFARTFSEEAAALARFIDSMPKLEVSNAFRAYAEDALAYQRQTQSDDLFGYEPVTAEEAFRRRFGIGQTPGEPGAPPRSEAEAIAPEAGQEEIPTLARSSGEAGGAVSTVGMSLNPISQVRDSGRQVSAMTPSGVSVSRPISPPSSRTGRPSRSLTLRARSIDPSSGKKILQPSEDLNSLLVLADEVRPRLEATLREIADEVGAQVQGVRVKADRAPDGSPVPTARLLSKVEGRSPATIGDYLGGRIAVDSFEQTDDIVRTLVERGWRLVEGEDDLFVDLSRGGYRARHVLIEDPSSGIVAELQLVPREIAAIQSEQHKIYDRIRGDFGPLPIQEIEQLEQQALRRWNEAWDAFLRRTGADPETGRVNPARGTHALAPQQRAPEPEDAVELDLFGQPVRRPRQASLLEAPAPARGMSQALAEARQTASLLEGRVQRGDATVDEIVRYQEAKVLLRRAEAMDADDVARLRRESGPALHNESTGDLFALSPRNTSEQLPDAGAFNMEDRPGAAPRPSDIQRELAAGLGVKVGEGRFGRGRWMRDALGIYKSRQEVIRLARAGDIGTLGHELGHHMHGVLLGRTRGGELSDAAFQRFPREILTELRSLARNISDESLAEGWAEFWRRYIDNPTVLPKQAPHLLRYVEGKLSGMVAEQRLLERARERWRLYRDASPEARFDAKISTNEKPLSEPIRDRLTRLRRDVIDDMVALERVQKAILQGEAPKTLDEDAVTLARLARGAADEAEVFLERGVIDFHTREITGKGLRQILEPIADRIDAFRRYITARRVQELHARGIDSGFRIEDANAIVEKYANDEAFARAFEGIQEYNDGLLRYLVDSGAMSEATYRVIKERNLNYVPFYRVRDDRAAAGGGSRLFGHVFNPVKRIKGSGRGIVDPLESIVKNTYLYVQTARRQMVSNALAELAERQGAGRFIERLPAPIRPEKVRLEQVESQLREIIGDEVFDEIRAAAKKDFRRMTEGMDPDEIRELGIRPYDPAEELLMFFRPGDYFQKENVISVLRDGKRVWYEVDPELYRALNALETEQIQTWVKLMSVPARTLRAGAILSPDFMASNPFRDQLWAFITSDHGYKPFVDVVRGLTHYLGKTDTFWRWKASGGASSALVSMDRKAMRASLENLLADRKQKITGVVRNPVEALRVLSELMEYSTRLGEYARAEKRLLRSGRSTREAQAYAGFAAREVSVDYARHGANDHRVLERTPPGLRQDVPAIQGKALHGDRARVCRDHDTVAPPLRREPRRPGLLGAPALGAQPFLVGETAQRDVAPNPEALRAGFGVRIAA